MLTLSRFGRLAVLSGALLVPALVTACGGGGSGTSLPTTAANSQIRNVANLDDYSSLASGGARSFNHIERVGLKGAYKSACNRKIGKMKNPYPIPDGYAPCDLWNAYNLTAARNQLGCPNSEPCGTVAVVNFYRDPTIAEDLVEYREAALLPACNPTTGSGCVVEMNQHGETGTKDLPPVDPTGNAAIEWAIDVDMVSANCPKCRIYAVEADFSPDDNKI